MNAMLDRIPFIVVKEYWFKNTASMMLDFIQKIMGMAFEAWDKPKDSNEPVSTENAKESSGSQDAKSTGNKIIDAIKEKFQTATLKDAAITLPYALYFCLRKKVFGNTYVFPYIVGSSTLINSASNESEWNEKGTGLMEGLKQLV